MQNKPKVWIVILAFAGAIGGVIAWAQLRPPRAGSPAREMNLVGDQRTGSVPTRAELADLRTKADAACRCARTGSHDQCWADYRRSAARFPTTGEWATACMEESVSVECFGPEGVNQLCVSTQREYGACSDAERRTRMAEARQRQARGCSG